jgi:ArsR family metal-binding transcriptional regulator
MAGFIKLENNDLIELYSQMLNRVNAVYKAGFYAWTVEKRPDLAKRLEILDQEINKVWEKCINGEASLEMFKAGVKLYEDTVRQSLPLFEGHP